jgi:hypothetical protein
MEKLNLVTELIAIIITAYEVLSRVIPTNKRWSLIGNILQILHKISDALDSKKEKFKN